MRERERNIKRDEEKERETKEDTETQSLRLGITQQNCGKRDTQE